jgi:hypothetical protein
VGPAYTPGAAIRGSAGSLGPRVVASLSRAPGGPRIFADVSRWYLSGRRDNELAGRTGALVRGPLFDDSSGYLLAFGHRILRREPWIGHVKLIRARAANHGPHSGPYGP